MNDTEKYIESCDLTQRFNDAALQFWYGPSAEVSACTFLVVAAVST